MLSASNAQKIIKQSKRFKISMHAFISLVSFENAACQIDATKCQLKLGGDAGWDALTYFKMHAFLLRKIYEHEPDRRTKFAKFIERQIDVTKLLISFEEKPEKEHLQMIKDELSETGQSLLYPWHTKDHQVYFDFIWHKDNGNFVIRAYDFGAGRNEKVIRPNYKPYELTFTSSEEFYKHVKLLIATQDQPSSETLFSRVFGQTRESCKSCVPEKSQLTNNCVVKNLLAATQQEACDLYDEGTEIFKEFYIKIIEEALAAAFRNLVPFPIQLPDLTTICTSISRSMQVFTGVACKEIFSGDIAILYNKVKTDSAPEPKPQPSSSKDSEDYDDGKNNNSSKYYYGS